MKKVEMLKVIKDAGAKFHALAAAVRASRSGTFGLNMDGVLEIVESGNKLCGETLSRRGFRNLFCARCSEVKPCQDHFKGL